MSDDDPITLWIDQLRDANDDSALAGFDQFPSREPTPEFAAEFVETCEVLFHSLDDHTLQKVVTLRMEGYTDTEVANQLSCSGRTVRRKLDIIRRHWGRLELASE